MRTLAKEVAAGLPFIVIGTVVSLAVALPNWRRIGDGVPGVDKLNGEHRIKAREGGGLI
jgi:hypothetical protein